MGHSSLTHREAARLNSIFDHESTSFYHYQFELAKEFRLTHDDNLPPNKFWEWEIYRHSINPSRFDHYHPIIGKWIEEIPQSSPMPPVPPPVIVPVCPPIYPPMPPECVPVVPPPHYGQMPGVPEPSGMVLMAIAIITGFVFIVAVRYLTKAKIDSEFWDS